MFGYLKKILFTGLVVLIPVVLLFLTLRELLELMIGFATPLADMLPSGYILENDPVELIAFVLIVLFSMFLGVLWTSKLTSRATRWLETRTLDHVPMYRMIKSLVAAFLELEEEDSFKPACWHHEDGSLEPVYVIAEHGKDMLVVMQPWTPTAFAGSIKVAPRSQVELIPVSLDDFSLALTHFGLGLSEALQKGESSQGEQQA